MTGKRRADPGAGRGRGRRRSGADREVGLPQKAAAAPPPASVNSTPPPSLVIQPQASRREVRAQRRRERRKRFGFAGGGVAIAIGVVIAIVLAFGVHKVVTDNGGTKRTQTTVLFQLQSVNRSAVGSMLLADDPGTKQGVEMMIQPRLITDVCGYGSQNFGDVLALPGGAAASREALSGVLNGVTVDGSWVLDGEQLATLINTLGGLHIDVDTNVIQRRAGGRSVIIVPAGTNVHVTGAQAVHYAVYQTGVQEGAAAQLLRLQRVIDATIQALPKTLNRIEALIRPLGSTAASTLGVPRLASLLLGLAADDQSPTGVYATDLPAGTIDAGGSAPSYRPDDSAVNGVPALVKSYLSASVPTDAGDRNQTVLLLNGTGLPGLVGSACPKLAAHGFAYGGSGNAPSFSNPHSQVQIFSDSDISQGDALAKALGLPRNDVVLGTLNQNVAKYVVILGKDYTP